MTLQRRWGCTAAGHTRLPILPRDLAAAAEHHADVTGVPACGTCPHVRVRTSSSWSLEVSRGLRLARETKGGVSFRSAVGREPHVWDVRAMDCLVTTWAAVEASDEAIRKAERETTKTPQ